MKTIVCPSGRVFQESDFVFLRVLALSLFIRFSYEPIYPFVNRTLSRLYVGGREDLSLNAWLFQEMLERLIQLVLTVFGCTGCRVPCLIGIPDAATGLASGVSARSNAIEAPIAWLAMHKEQKTYGAHQKRWTDAPPENSKFKYGTIDNVTSFGTSKEKIAEQLIDDGFDPVPMPHIVLVDYGLGAIERLRKQGLRIVPLFDLADLIYAFGELDLEPWSRSKVEGAQAEIARLRALHF